MPLSLRSEDGSALAPGLATDIAAGLVPGTELVLGTRFIAGVDRGVDAGLDGEAVL